MNYIYKENEPIRLDKFLSIEIDSLSREKIKTHIKNGCVSINGVIIKVPKHNLKEDDKIKLLLKDDDKNSELKPWEEGLMPEVIFENEDYLIINKPSGLVVHPGIGNTEKTLVNILLAKNIKLSNASTMRPGIVHRLDKNTSGIMIIAKNDQFHSYITDRFANKEIDKKYHLLSEGKYRTAKGIIDVPIGRDSNNRKLMKAQLENSKPAKSVFRVIESFKNNEYVEFKIYSGRTHQIRVHSKFIGSPILNDPEYGRNIFDSEFGQFLHAVKISFKNNKGEEVTYTAKLPGKFEQKLEELRILKQ